MSTSSEVLPTAPPAALREIDDLPHPPGLPWLGNTLQIDKPHVHQQVEGWARRYGDFFTISIGGHRLLVIADHKAMGAVLRDRPEGFGARRASPPSPARSASAGVFGAGRALEAAAADGDGRLRPAPPARYFRPGPRLRPAGRPLAARRGGGLGHRPAGRPDALHRRRDLRPGLRGRRQHARVRRRHHPAPPRQDLSGDVPPPVRALPHLALVPDARRSRARCERAQGQCGDRRLRRRRPPAPRCRPGAPRRPGQPARGDDRRRRRPGLGHHRRRGLRQCHDDAARRRGHHRQHPGLGDLAALHPSRGAGPGAGRDRRRRRRSGDLDARALRRDALARSLCQRDDAPQAGRSLAHAPVPARHRRRRCSGAGRHAGVPRLAQRLAARGVLRPPPAVRSAALASPTAARSATSATGSRCRSAPARGSAPAGTWQCWR